MLSTMALIFHFCTSAAATCGRPRGTLYNPKLISELWREKQFWIKHKRPGAIDVSGAEHMKKYL
jgi:hypothetical protein